MSGYVYILKSLLNGRFYVGSTDNLSKRLEEHNTGKSKYTRTTKPFTMVFSQEFESLTLAKKAEFWIKKQKDKDFLCRLIAEGNITKQF